VGVLPRTRRRSVHDSRNLSRAPAASLRDRLRRPLTEPVCRMVRQLSGSGEGPGTGQGPVAGNRPEMAMRTRASRCHSLGATPGATGMNNLPALRTHLNSEPERARGRELF
jgi:hypothetical protein